VGSVAGRRWIIDSGNFDYEDSSMRRYCRSSMAHNVVTVDGQNQCDIWSKFRMGRRGRVSQLTEGEQSGFCWASASHDGYRQLGVERLKRVVAVNPENCCWICIDFASGDRQLPLLGYLHLAQHIKIRGPENLSDRFRTFYLDDGASQRRIDFFGVDQVRILKGWHCPAFGVRETSSVFEYRQTTATRTPPGWAMYKPDSIVRIDDERDDRIIVQCDEQPDPFVWTFD
jgi:hypothetical protein